MQRNKCCVMFVFSSSHEMKWECTRISESPGEVKEKLKVNGFFTVLRSRGLRQISVDIESCSSLFIDETVVRTSVHFISTRSRPEDL